MIVPEHHSNSTLNHNIFNGLSLTSEKQQMEFPQELRRPVRMAESYDTHLIAVFHVFHVGYVGIIIVIDHCGRRGLYPFASSCLAGCIFFILRAGGRTSSFCATERAYATLFCAGRAQFVVCCCNCLLVTVVAGRGLSQGPVLAVLLSPFDLFQ